MPRTVAFSGTQTCTPGSTHLLQTWDVPTGGATYVLVVDAANLVNGEVLLASVHRETRANVDALRKLFEIGMASHAGSGCVETPFFGAAALVSLQVAISQMNGTARDIPWAIERVDG